MAIDFAAVAENRRPDLELPVSSLGMSLEQVRDRLKARYDENINNLVEMADTYEVNDALSEKTAIEIAGGAKGVIKKIEAERKRIIDEPDTFVRGVNGLCKAFRDRLERVETGLKKKVGDFQWSKELERRKREKEAQEAAARLQDKINKEAKAAGVEAPLLQVAIPVEKKQTVTRADSGASAHIRIEWKVTEVVNFAEVPDEYKCLDEKKINLAIKAGIRQIPGLKIGEVPITNLRA